MGLAFAGCLPCGRGVGDGVAARVGREPVSANAGRGVRGRRRGRQRADSTDASVLAAPASGTVAPASPPAPVHAPAAPADAGRKVRSVPQGVLNCVVKLFVTHCAHSYEMPWVMEKQWRSTSSGFLVEGRRILTCAHCIENATVVLVKLHGLDEKFSASVAAVSFECDTAVLRVDDGMFWDEVDHAARRVSTQPFLRLASLPDLQAECTVIGYPFPGESICVTQGVCSRIEVRYYPDQFMPRMLAVQLDAAVNEGNSGGPVFNDQFECVGIAFMGMPAADVESCAYFVPTLIVEHFLKDLEMHNGRYTGFPELGFRIQKLENKQMRQALGLKDDPGELDSGGSGVLIREVFKTSDASRVLKRGDILTSIDGIPVSNSGTVPFDELPGERIEMQFVSTSRFVGDNIALTFLRDSKPCEATMCLSAYGESKLVQSRAARQYLIYGGLVFLVLSVKYLEEKFNHEIADAPLSFLLALYEGVKKGDGVTEIVILGHVLAAQVNIGFETHGTAILRKVNGTVVKSLAHLAQTLDDVDADRASKYIEFELEDNELIILNKAKARESLSKILDMYAVPSARMLPPSCGKAT